MIKRRLWGNDILEYYKGLLDNNLINAGVKTVNLYRNDLISHHTFENVANDTAIDKGAILIDLPIGAGYEGIEYQTINSIDYFKGRAYYSETRTTPFYTTTRGFTMSFWINNTVFDLEESDFVDFYGYGNSLIRIGAGKGGGGINVYGDYGEVGISAMHNISSEPQHFIITYDGVTATIYQNNEVIGSGAISLNHSFGVSNLTTDFYIEIMTGFHYIGDARFYQNVITSTERARISAGTMVSGWYVATPPVLVNDEFQQYQNDELLIYLDNSQTSEDDNYHRDFSAITETYNLNIILHCQGTENNQEKMERQIEAVIRLIHQKTANKTYADESKGQIFRIDYIGTDREYQFDAQNNAHIISTIKFQIQS